MAMKLAVARTQWAVGNGFFHTGTVSTSDDSIQYLYDCGALSPAANQAALRREIDTFTERGAEIDFAFLSHFDMDHVSGLPRLTAGVSIKRFFIPLIPAVERLLIFAGNLDGTNLPPDEARFYQRLIVDPAGALTALTEGAGEPATVVTVAATTPTPPDREATEPIEGLTRDEIEKARTAGPLAINVGPQEASVAVGNDVVWEWIPYVATAAVSATPEFVNSLIRQRLISDASELDDSALIAHLVENEEKGLTAAYDSASRAVGSSFNRNVTSLMLYSGPRPGSRIKAYRARSNPWERAEIGAWDPRPGWLGLGDANLRSEARVNEVNDAFHARKPYVGTFAPSHHGSSRDWDQRLMTGFHPTPGRLPVHVFGASGSYGHPHSEVLHDINEAGATAVSVGLSATSRWTEDLSVYLEP